MAKEFQLSIDAEALVKSFEAAPEKTRDLVQLQLKIAVERIRDYASNNHRYISRTGNLERSGLDTEVSGAVGSVWVDDKKVPYAKVIHEGHGPYVIVPREKKALRWPIGDHFYFAKRVNMPALEPDQFLYDAADHEAKGIEKDFGAAIEQLLREL